MAEHDLFEGDMIRQRILRFMRDCSDDVEIEYYKKGRSKLTFKDSYKGVISSVTFRYSEITPMSILELKQCFNMGTDLEENAIIKALKL